MKKQVHKRSNIKHFVLLLGLLAVVILVGCSTSGNDTDSAADPLQNIEWQWVSVTEKATGTETTVPNPEAYTIVFNPDGTITGQADCNSFGGTYSQESGFSITIGATTMAFCGENSLDQQYLILLGSVAAGGPDGSGGLALETAGGAERMLFQMVARHQNPNV